MISGTAAPARAADGDTTPSVAAPDISGHWIGSKLQCRKEEGKTVRCGKPAAFDITFLPEGRGTTPDADFPKEFTYRWTSPAELTVTPVGGGEELNLFQVEIEDRMLTFQAYIYLPLRDPGLPAEARYIHFIFDVNRDR